MNIRPFVDALDRELASDTFPDGQHNGLQVEGDRPVRRIATAVSVSRATIDAALAWDADVLLTHHGLLWHNQPLHVQGVRRDRLARILSSGMHLVSYHLPLDAHPTLGNNAALAQAAGVRDAAPGFAWKGRPIGMRGTIEEQGFSDWVQTFERTLRDGCDVPTGPFSVWPFGPSEVRTIGFVSGAAPYQVQDAIDLGLDVYVTGEATEGVYHLAKEAGIHFIAGGHYLTERGGIRLLGEWAAERWGLDHRFFDVETLA